MRVFDVGVKSWWDNADPKTEGCNDYEKVRVLSDDMDFAISKAKEQILGDTFEWEDDDGVQHVCEVTFVKVDSCVPVLDNIDVIADDILDEIRYGDQEPNE